MLAGALALASNARANGRAPATSTIHFRDGHDSDVVVGLTFGVVFTHDGGATWQWMCEDAVGYGGMYDPVYRYAADGTVFATTFSGLRATRDECVFAPLASGSAFTSTDALGPDEAYYAGESTPTESEIFKSTTDGSAFGSGVTPPGSMPNDWWQTISVAPSDATRVYLAGYRSEATSARVFLLYRSNDGGATFAALPTTAFTTSPNTIIEIVGVDPTNPDVVYAHATAQNGMSLHGLYRSADGGATWTSLLTVSDPAFAFVARGNGDLIVGTQLAGTSVSHDHGQTWTAIPTAPHINCLIENAAGEVWACTQNYGVGGGSASDNAGVMKSTDAVTWTPVLRYQDITQPVACSAGTIEHDTCQLETWCGLVAQLGITSTAIPCGVKDEPPGLDAPTMSSTHAGCCDAGADPTGSFVLALGVLLFSQSRRRSFRTRPRDVVV